MTEIKQMAQNINTNVIFIYFTTIDVFKNNPNTTS